MAIISAPFHPIIYVRGFAMTRGEIEATTATPYMGFNQGSTKARQYWDGEVTRHYFESPLIRLMKDYGYQDAYLDGRLRTGQLPARTVFIHRYYDEADEDFGSGKRPSILEAAKSLRELISSVRKAVCGDDRHDNRQARQDFRVHLVAHSMGGLICRALLQNVELRDTDEAARVDKVFTYGTPHNGIEMAGFNVPKFLGIWDIDNFNRDRMKQYLSLPSADNVAGLGGHFDPERFFCLIGTNPHDYDVARGLSSRLAGDMSDGLVRIENAYVSGAPRAYVHRSHGGPFGIVNSEEGYQNLVRFLFGDIRIDGILELDHLPLPPSVQRAKDDGKEIRASYWFEASVSPRPSEGESHTYYLSDRRKTHFSAIFRKYDEMMKPARAGLQAPRWPFLFSTHLDTSRIRRGSTLVFSVRLVVTATDYEIDGFLSFDRTIPGENLYQDTLSIRTTRGDDGWRVRFNRTGEHWGETRGRELSKEGSSYILPIESRKGLRGRLKLRLKLD
ncbi:MAG: hypothetical protein V2J10_00195 [Wenzhouxiangella sp.]|nr:hypothetical protein [Wenzhouxiangella sp.]